MKKKSIKTFIKENREEIDAIIKPHTYGKINDEERKLWILNDESLYRWALEEGVNI